MIMMFAHHGTSGDTYNPTLASFLEHARLIFTYLCMCVPSIFQKSHNHQPTHLQHNVQGYREGEGEARRDPE